MPVAKHAEALDPFLVDSLMRWAFSTIEYTAPIARSTADPKNDRRICEFGFEWDHSLTKLVPSKAPCPLWLLTSMQQLVPQSFNYVEVSRYKKGQFLPSHRPIRGDIGGYVAMMHIGGACTIRAHEKNRTVDQAFRSGDLCLLTGKNLRYQILPLRRQLHTIITFYHVVEK